MAAISSGFRFASVTLAVGSFAAVAPAQSNAWGASIQAQSLYSVDLATGAATLVGSFGGEITALAHDPNSDTLYGIQRSPGRLVTIDRTTGATTLVGMLGMEKVAAGATYDPNTGTLYMVDFVNSQNLWTVDTTTGAATIVGPHGIATLQGLAFDPNSNTLYATGTGLGLYTIDPATGTATFVGPFSEPVFDHGLGFDVATDTLYLAEANTGDNRLFVVNPATGGLTSVGLLGADIQGFEVEMEPGGPSTPICFGDGTGAACPCLNNGGPGAGCANGTGGGGLLSASGTPSVTSDSLSLTADGVINNNGLFFQGNNTIGGGAGTAFGDGIRCCGGSVVRIQVVNPPGSTSPATAQMTETATTNGPGGTITAGTKKCYQFWYRDPASSPCGAQFNLTNAVTVTWQP